MRERVEAREPGERRSNYRAYLVTYSHYLTEVGRYSEAKEIFGDTAVFSKADSEAAVREIETVQAYRTRGR
jgi:hypothetical protein